MIYLQETNDANYLRQQGTAQYTLILRYALKIMIWDNVVIPQREEKKEDKHYLENLVKLD